ncbi:MAG TPA: acylase [Haliangium sp.]|nr:acylase [Haliangium sp.]
MKRAGAVALRVAAWVAAVIAGVAVLALAVLGVRLLLRPPVVPPGLASVGAAYDVEILRDTWGVPHVFGKADADVAHGLAYAHAEDDFPLIQDTLLAARGKLASVHGQDAAPNDYMVHLLRIRDVVDAGYPRLDERTRALCQGYADGLNLYAALHPEQARRGLYPVRGQDIVAAFVHKAPLFFGLDKVLSALFAEDTPPLGQGGQGGQGAQGRSGFGPAARGARVDLLGSNALAVAPARSADGSTFLVVNSHQPWTGPVAWYEAHLHSEEGWDMVGGLFPGVPVILHGHNRHLGWAHTVNAPDLIDVFELEIDPDDPDRYRFDGAWRDLEVREAPIEVALWGPVSWTFEREVLWSVYGPVVRRPHGTYALRFAGFGEVGAVEQWYRMNRATSFDEWQQAMRSLAVPMFNTVYADRAGNVYYLYGGRLPVRASGHDWRGTVPGRGADTLWTEHLPFDELPQVRNPASGFVQSCNGTPFQATAGPDNPRADRYGPGFGIETHQTNRSLRALALLESDASITAEELLAYKFDMAYAPGSRMADLVARVTAAPAPADPLLAEAVAVLRDWDLRAVPESEQAALAILTFQRWLIDAEPVHVETAALLDALSEAARTLRTHHGRLTVPWREVNRLRRGSVDLGLGGAPDVLHAVYGEPSDGHLVGRAGDSYIMFARWDAQGRVSSQSVHQFGSATRDAASPHYADQASLFVERRLKDVWLDEADIRAHLERAYRPGQEARPQAPK